ncbi:lytic polysaccharide monooxygenase [Nocardiopsis trehalosi]|uniref:lytic polysaccharide monooxygenase n=1 Tax=Nocardiopsis trehalosi TaxID=109329 RepID=UPI000A42C0EF|nr:lytic polysaccharide monooxygenase [Nocardiopsis trehalosi]
MTPLRATALIGGLAALAGGFAVALPAEPAAAHGGLTFPATRTYACYRDGIDNGNGGSLDPANPMCADALAYSSYPFWNWFGNLISDAGGRHREIIADGELCGPTDQFAAFNAPGTAWPATEVESGADVTFRYNAWAPHPGTWSQYVTRDGWDPDEPLGWDDLEPLPFDEVTNPPLNGSGPDGAEYTWDATLPEKSGRHIIYSIWQRSDSPEAFYNCADVEFTGGGGGEEDTEAPTAPGTPTADRVTGDAVDLSWAAATDDDRVARYEVRDAATGEVAATSSTASATVTGLEPETAYRFHVVALDRAGNVSPPSGELAVTTLGADVPSGSCEVDFSVASQWSGGYTANVVLTNTGDAAVDGWTVDWEFTDGSVVTNGWSAEIAQHGAHVMAENAAWNGSVPAGGSVSFGFNASVTGAPDAPEAFRLDGSACAAG